MEGDDHFAETMHAQHKIGKTDSMDGKTTSLAHYTPLPPIFPLLRWGKHLKKQNKTKRPTPNVTMPYLGDSSFYNGHVTRAAKILT